LGLGACTRNSTRARRARAAGLLASLALAATAAAALLAAGWTAAPASAQSPFISTPVVAATVRPTEHALELRHRHTDIHAGSRSRMESTPGRVLRELQMRIISVPEAYVGIGGRIDSVVNPRVDVWAGEAAPDADQQLVGGANLQPARLQLRQPGNRRRREEASAHPARAGHCGRI
jgi:hypothetical protein